MTWPLKRRRASTLAAFAAITFGACAVNPMLEDELPSSDAPHAAAYAAAPDLTVHALRVGWVRVKTAHREFGGLEGTRFLSVILDGDWAEWMPIIVYAVEHPGGITLVDTGPSPRINEPGYYDCDPNAAFFYGRNLRFHDPPGERLLDRMEAAGLDPARVDQIVITHWHADHIGGIESLPGARVITGDGNWPGHVGAFTCRLPEGFEPEQIAQPITSPSRSHRLREDGRVRMVAMPGHTPGHVGVWVDGGDGADLLLVGDATFDDAQTSDGDVAGVSESIEDARATQRRLREERDGRGTVLLPAHDPAIFSKLSSPR